MKTPLPVISSDEDSVAAIHSRSLRLIRDLAVYCHLSSPTWQALRTLKHDLEHERARRAVGGKTGRGIRDTRLADRTLREFWPISKTPRGLPGVCASRGTEPLKRSDLDEFVACYHPDNRHERKPTWSETNPEGRWRCFTYEELAKRDKLNLDIFWIKDKSLEDADSLPEPDVLAQEIADDLQTALELFGAIATELNPLAETDD